MSPSLQRVSRFTFAALVLSVVAVIVTAWVTWHIFEAMPHLEDEVAYAWQAAVIAKGQLTLPSPEYRQSFLVPFVVDYQGRRFGKYPLGWPVLLAVGVRLGIRWLINPLLAGFGTWLTFLLGKRLFNERVGLLAAVLTLTSPFFLMNSGSLLSHPFGLVLSAAFVLAWLEAFAPAEGPLTELDNKPSFKQPWVKRPWVPTFVAALTLGGLILTRPFTAVAVCLPFALHGLYLLIRGDWPTRRRLLVMGTIVLILASLLFLWQFAVTGDPMLNPYTLWWSYDTVGFGPSDGLHGNTLARAWVNTADSLRVGWSDLFGWGEYSWIFFRLGCGPPAAMDAPY